MITWQVKSFSALSPAELYAILQLRIEVFVVEQQCIFQDLDGKDADALHLMGWQENKLIAYTRLLPAGIGFAERSIGRVVTSPSVRGQGLGKPLMLESIRQVYEHFGTGPIRIGAQYYLKDFYSSLGFIAEGDIYLEDGIEHVEMILP